MSGTSALGGSTLLTLNLRLSVFICGFYAYFAAVYLRSLGGINETSTGSYSNLMFPQW